MLRAYIGLTSLGLTTMKVCLPNLTTQQTFVMVECLSPPAILGCDLWMRHGMIIDFQKGTFCSRESMLLEGRLNLPEASPACSFGRGLPTSYALQKQHCKLMGHKFPRRISILHLTLFWRSTRGSSDFSLKRRMQQSMKSILETPHQGAILPGTSPVSGLRAWPTPRDGYWGGHSIKQ